MDNKSQSKRKWINRPCGQGNGFIFQLTCWILYLLNGINIMEGFKVLARWLADWKPNNDNTKYARYAHVAVDVYTLLKWATVLILYKSSSCRVATFIVWYLLIANLHTFFYYFIFKKDPEPDFDRSRKRFIKLGIAFLFFDLCFAYLYSHPYYRDFQWPSNPHHGAQAFWYSLANSMAADYKTIIPSEFGERLAIIQHVITFLFIGVLVAKAIPSNKPS